MEKKVYWDQDNDPATPDELIHRSGIAFELYDSNNNKLATLITDEDGMIEYRLEAGDYYLIESTPEGDYEIDKDQVTTDSQSTENYIDADGKIHIRVEQSKINTFFTEENSVRNETSKGRFYLTKKTYTNNAQSYSIGLEGAQYTLEKLVDGEWRYCVNGKPVEGTVSGETYPAGSVFTVDEARGYESGLLDTGTYRVTEVTAPKSISNGSEDVTFIIDPTPITFEIKARTTVELEQYDGILRTLQIKKTADALNGNKVLANVTFELFAYDENAESHKGTSMGERTTNGNGVAEWKYLNPGKYILEEKSAPTGYAPVTVEIELENSRSYVDVVQTETVVNKSTHGRIVIKKTDKNGATLNGAEFTIYGKNDVVQDIVKIETDGIGTSNLLPTGTYRVVETKAPDGYSLDERLEPLEKEVVVSGNQNPGNNFVGVNPTAVAGYTDLVIFQNKKVADIAGFKSSIDKNVKLEESVSGFEKTAQSDKSLMYEDVTADFRISGLTDGNNELPAEKFVVTDESLAFQSLAKGADAGVDNNYSDYKSGEALTAQDYVMNFVRLYKSVNKDGSKVTATVKAKTGGSWQDVKTEELSELEDTEYVTIMLPENSTGFQIVYNHVGTGFSAGDIEVNVTFKQRPSDETMPDIRRIVNTAVLEWEDTAKDRDGQPDHNKGTVPAEAAVKFLQYDAELPTLELVNNITNVPDKGRFYGGDNIAYETVGGVTEPSAEPLELPVMGISLPAYTTLDTS